MTNYSISSDCIYEIGSSHKVCQDYALSGARDGLGYAIVSDGCSSSNHSDVGARIIAHTARDIVLYMDDRAIWKNKGDQEIVQEVFQEILIKKCIEIKGSLGLPISAFDATLLLSVVTKDDCIQMGWGDGHFLYRWADGSVEVRSIEYESGAPYYLSYEFSEDRKQRYKKEYGDQNRITRLVVLSKDKEPVRDPYWTYNSMSPSHFEIAGIESHGTLISDCMVFSDGVNTYQYDSRYTDMKEDLLGPDIAIKFSEYKNPVGEFITRRANKIRSENAKRHIIHYDDVSCAAVHLEEVSSPPTGEI